MGKPGSGEAFVVVRNGRSFAEALAAVSNDTAHPLVVSPFDGTDVLMYTPFMRRIQIYIEEELDETLQAEAARTGRSKAAIIRESVRAWIGWPAKAQKDPITALVGSIDAEPAEIDEEVYGR